MLEATFVSRNRVSTHPYNNNPWMKLKPRYVLINDSSIVAYKMQQGRMMICNRRKSLSSRKKFFETYIKKENIKCL